MNQLRAQFQRAIQLIKSSSEADQTEAREIFQWCAQQGHSASCVNVGITYEDGVGGDVDLAQAERWYRQAADAGNASGKYHLGVLLYRLDKSDEAVRLLREAASEGRVPAEIWLGVAKEEGVGCERDVGAAIEIYRTFADQSSLATLRLGLCFQDGVGVGKDAAMAERLYRRAGDDGQASAWNNLAVLLYDQRRDREAFELMEKAATLGCPEAWGHCGEAYAFGTECPIDLKKGVALLQRAAAAGQPRAKYLLAYFMVTAPLAERDPDAAYLLCREAAEAEEPEAQHMLGVMYMRGDGVERDTAAGESWWRRAAKAGNEAAQSDLQALRP